MTRALRQRVEDFILPPYTKNGFSYLASPYSVKNAISDRQAVSLRARRYKTVCRMAAHLMKQGHIIFCPIAHSHPIEILGMPGEVNSGDFWLKQDYPVLEKAKELLVYQMDGWDQSYGVAKEIALANEIGIPIRYIPNVVWQRGFTGYKKKSSYWERESMGIKDS